MICRCEQCGEPFEVRYPRSQPQRFCSRNCAARQQWTGSGNPRFNGGLSQWPDGRVVICCIDGTIQVFARAVMEAELGRVLRPEEVVHHKNGDPTDDRLENLEVLSRAKHIEIHRAELEIARGIRSAA